MGGVAPEPKKGECSLPRGGINCHPKLAYWALKSTLLFPALSNCVGVRHGVHIPDREDRPEDGHLCGRDIRYPACCCGGPADTSPAVIA